MNYRREGVLWTGCRLTGRHPPIFCVSRNRVGETMWKDKRFRQANREALLALAAYGIYFLWWYGFGYGLGDADPDNYTYVFGFPAWFFYSCLLGYPLITLLLWVLVRLFFKNMPLDADPVEESASGVDGGSGTVNPGPCSVQSRAAAPSPAQQHGKAEK